MELEAVAEKAAAVRRELQKVIVGMDSVLDQTVVALLAGGHILLKVRRARPRRCSSARFRSAIRGQFHRIQFTPDLMPADIVGVNIFNPQSLVFQFAAGPVFCDLLLADEMNLRPGQDAIGPFGGDAGRASQRRSPGTSAEPGLSYVRYAEPDRIRRHLPAAGAQLDRFLFKIVAGYPEKQQEVEVLSRYQSGFDAARTATYGVEPCTSVAELAEMRAAVRQVSVAAQLLEYIVAITRGTRELPSLTLGASPRAAVMILLASKALAVLRGRNFVTPDDVRDLAVPTLRHRIVLNPEAEIEGMTADQCVARVLERIEVPRI